MSKKQKQDEDKSKKAKAPPVRTPKGMLPRKQNTETTGGKLNGERYCPGKRIKSAHRKAKSTLSLRKFAETYTGATALNWGRNVKGDWFANKAASGRGY